MTSMQPEGPLIPALATPAFAGNTEPATNALSGPYGLRAGWGILLFFVLSVLFGVVLFVGLFKSTGKLKPFLNESAQARTAAEHARKAHEPPQAAPVRVSFTLLSEAAQTGAVLLAALGLTFLEKRRFGVYGLRTRYLKDVLPGALAGLVAISLLVALLRALHLVVFDARLLNGADVFRLGAEWLLAFVLVGVFEEFFFRGYIQFTLMRGLLGLGAKLSPAHTQRAAFWMAAVLWSLLFSLTHLSNAGEDPFGLIMVFVAGILFSYALWKTGSLWWGIGFHLTWDWGQSFLFGVPDSGTLSAGRLFGTHAVGNPLVSGAGTGPEGSVFVFPVLLLVALVLKLHPQRPLPPVAPESLPLIPHSPAPRPIP